MISPSRHADVEPMTEPFGNIGQKSHSELIAALWGRTGATVPLDALPESFRRCLADGDGLADQYGGRTPFVFAAQRADHVLVLEKHGGHARVIDVLNCTGGYGTGILGRQVAALEHELRDGGARAATAHEALQTVERCALIDQLRHLVAGQTGTGADDWELAFTSSGTEAMDLARQLVSRDGLDLGTGQDARQHKDTLIACHGAWHGWGMTPDQRLDRRQLTEGVPRVTQYPVAFMRYGNEASLREVFERHRGRIRGVFVEGLLGDGGVVRGSDSWWRLLFELAAAEDAKIVDDESLTGFRCGRFLAIPEKLAPDCVTLGKALGLGLFPLSAVLWRKARLRLHPGIAVRTCNVRPFQARVVSAGLAMIERQGLVARARASGERVMGQLQALAGDHPTLFKAVRGMGFCFGLELAGRYARKGRAVRDALLREGVLAELASGLVDRQLPKEARINETIRLTPSLAMAEADLDQLVARITRAAKALVAAEPIA